MNGGAAAEALAARFLTARGLAVVDRNYRCRAGEIDLIVRDGKTLASVDIDPAQPFDGLAAENIEWLRGIDID